MQVIFYSFTVILRILWLASLAYLAVCLLPLFALMAMCDA